MNQNFSSVLAQVSLILLMFFRCTIFKTRASLLSGYPNTEKQMKALGRKPSAFTVSRCLHTPIKHEA